MPGVLPCFQSANCFPHELPVYKPSCFCSSMVTQCRSTVQLFAKSLPATPALPELGAEAHMPTPKALLQVLFPWSQVHNTSPPVASVAFPRYKLVFPCPRRAAVKAQRQKAFCSEMEEHEDDFTQSDVDSHVQLPWSELSIRQVHSGAYPQHLSSILDVQFK